MLFLALGAPVAVWAIGGLEQPLYAALLALSFSLLFSFSGPEAGIPPRSKIMMLSLVLGLLCITRPDGPLFTVITVFSLTITSYLQKKKHLFVIALKIIPLPVLFVAGQVAFRLLYYGEFLPNPALVKIAPSLHHFYAGLDYLGSGLISLFPFSIVAIAFLFLAFFDPTPTLKNVQLLTTFIFWSAYVAFIGGDIFPANRHLVPLMVVLAFALFEGTTTCFTRLAKGKSGSVYSRLFIITMMIFFIPYILIQQANDQYQRAREERWEWQGKELGLLLKRAFSEERPLIAVNAAGCLPYWSELPALDMLGLNDYYLPRNRPDDFGAGILGHELGDGHYVLSRNPDIIIFNIGSRPHFKTGQELEKNSEFHARYLPVQVITFPGAYVALIYFSKFSSKTGVRISASEIGIPGYLFTGVNSLAYLNQAGKLVAHVQAGQSVSISLPFQARDQSEKTRPVMIASRAECLHSILTHNDETLSIVIFSTCPEPTELEWVNF